MAAALGACKSSGQPTVPTSPSPPPAGGTLATGACQIGSSSQGGPITDPAGPYFHSVVVARTDNGVSMRDARQVLEHASVPDGARLGGSVLVYYVNGAEGSVWVARLDGNTAAPIGPIVINGIARPQGVVDPDATALPGGGVRLAFLNGFGPPDSTARRAMCLADSIDGINFNVVATALSFAAGELLTDPSLARLRNGSWLMAISRGQSTVLARSSDGLTFTAGETLGYGGVPELATLPDGRLRLYVCARGIESYVSADEGSSWQREGPVVAPEPGGPRIICDPSMIAGTDMFIYKVAS